MKKISLAKIEIVEIEVLQKELQNFLTYKNHALDFANPNKLTANSNEYFDTLLVIDILQKLYYNLRGKIEKTSKTHANLTLTISEAVMLLQCCNDCHLILSEYQKFVLFKISQLLQKELLNIN